MLIEWMIPRIEFFWKNVEVNGKIINFCFYFSGLINGKNEKKN